MKKALITLTLAAVAALATAPASAADECDEKCQLQRWIGYLSGPQLSAAGGGGDGDPCQIVICMMGLVNGASPGECAGAVANYFSVIKFRKGKPDLGATVSARLGLTQGCGAAPGFIIDTISAAYGAVIR